MRWLVIVLVVVLAAAVACEPEPEEPTTAPRPDQTVLTPASFGELPGWPGDRHAEVLPAFLRSCGFLSIMQ